MTAEDTLAQLADLGISFTGTGEAASIDLSAIRARAAAAAKTLAPRSQAEPMRQLLETDVPRLLAALEAAREEIAWLKAAVPGEDGGLEQRAPGLLADNSAREPSHSMS